MPILNSDQMTLEREKILNQEDFFHVNKKKWLILCLVTAVALTFRGLFFA